MKTLIPVLAIAVLGSFGALRAEDAAPKPYPLKTCVVSDESYDEMGKPYVFTYEGQEVKLCCKKCKKAFDKDPEKYMKKIQAAEAAEAPSKN